MNTDQPRPTRLWQSPTIVWVALMAATILTTWVFSKDIFAATVGTGATLALAGWKVRLVVLDFMELRQAPWPLRIAFEGWSLIVPSMIFGFYLTA